jgi:hypothetical protein
VRDGLLAVTTFVIPARIVADTIQFLRQVGAKGFEGFVLWAGKLENDSTFAFSTSIVPAQHASVTESGLLVTVTGESLFAVNRFAHSNGVVLAAQVHSHPTHAYHSTTDDEYPLVTLVGALSVVIPDFARLAPADLEKWAWYRLSKQASWDALDDRTEIVFQ